MSSIKLARRLTWHVILIIAGFNMLIIGAILFSNFTLSELESQVRGQHLIEGVSGQMESMLKILEFCATNNVAEIEDNLDNPEKVYGALEHELRLNNRYMGCAVAFVPDYYPSEGRWFEPYVRMIDSTHVERQQRGSEQNDYFHQEWYTNGLNLERGKGYLSDVIPDKNGGDGMTCFYVMPIFDRHDRKVGVYVIDIHLGALEKSINLVEDKVKKIEDVENDPDDPDDDDVFFFIQLIDKKGKKIAGSETFDEKSLETILEKDSILFEETMIKDTSYGISSKRIANTGWTLVVAQHEGLVFLNGYILAVFILFFMTIGGIAIFFFMRRSIRRSIQPLSYLSNSAREVAHGNFDTQLPTFKHHDEISELRDSFEFMQHSLVGYIDELKDTTSQKERIESELRIAHDIQMSMVPAKFPKYDGLDMYAMMEPAKEVGGDLYGYLLQGDNLYFCVGDVSGKGVPASLFMAQATRLFRTLAAQSMMPAEIVARINDALSGDDNKKGMFVTFFLGLLNLTTGHLDFCNAGHNAPVIGGDNNCDFLKVISNVPIGLIPGFQFKGEEIESIKGRPLFIYSDGLNEAENKERQQFGNERMLDLLRNTKIENARQAIELLVDRVKQYRDGAEANDDLTMMVVYLK